MKKYPSTRFQRALAVEEACAPARTWVAAQRVDQAWETCDNADWLRWLVYRVGRQHGGYTTCLSNKAQFLLAAWLVDSCVLYPPYQALPFDVREALRTSVHLMTADGLRLTFRPLIRAWAVRHNLIVRYRNWTD